MVSITLCSGFSTLIVLDFSLLTNTSPVAAVAAPPVSTPIAAKAIIRRFTLSPFAARDFPDAAAGEAPSQSTVKEATPSAAIPSFAFG